MNLNEYIKYIQKDPDFSRISVFFADFLKK
jgi:hypothetical protein